MIDDDVQVAAWAPSTNGGPYGAVLARALAGRRRDLAAALTRLESQSARLAAVADMLIATLRAGRTVLVAGNGGSAAGAQHFAAELVGRFRREREPYPIVALCTDSAVVTAVANDYGYEQVFARQVAAFGRAGDLLVVISTSGESENLVRAAVTARRRGLTVLAVTGERDSRLAALTDLAVRVPTDDTALVQELHLIVTHVLCDLVEAELAIREGAGGP